MASAPDTKKAFVRQGTTGSRARPIVVPPSFVAGPSFRMRRPLVGRGPAVREHALSSANGARSVSAYWRPQGTRFGEQLAGPFGIWRGTGSHLSRFSEPARMRTRPGRRLFLSPRLYESSGNPSTARGGAEWELGG